MPPKKKEPIGAPTDAIPLKTVEIPSQLFVTKTFKNNEETTDDTIAVHQFVTEPGRVEFRAGLSINLGNFENVRIDIGIVLPTYREESDAAYEYAKQFVTSRLEAEVEEIRNGKNKKKNEDPF